MLSYADHLGLYAEEIGSNGEALGNLPQAFTHLALISAAFNLDRIAGVAAKGRLLATPATRKRRWRLLPCRKQQGFLRKS